MSQLMNDISEILRSAPQNCWLALREDQSEVVGSGDTPDAAVDAAQAKGVQEPVLLWAPAKWIPSVY